MPGNIVSGGKMQSWVIVLSVMGIYLVLALVVGVLAGRRRAFSIEEFVVGGRRFGVILTVFLISGTWFSAFAFLGGPGWAFSRGAAVFYILGYLAPAYVLWWAIGPKTARIGKKMNLVTQGDLLRERYQDRLLPALVAIVATFAFIQYICVQLKGTAYLINVFTEGHVPMWAGALIAYAIVVIYVILSGVRGAAWSDVLQGALMVIIAWVMGLYIVYHLYGSPTTMFRQIHAAYPGHLIIGGPGSKMNPATFSTLIILCSIGAMMWPHIFMKGYVAEERTIKKTILVFPILGIFLVPIFFIGFAGVMRVASSELTAADQILPHMIYNILSVPPIVIGLVGAGALAASMSSADAITHGAGSVFIQDIVRVIKPDMSEKAVVWSMRMAVLIIGIIAYALTFGAQTLVGLLIGGYNFITQIAPPVYGAFYWRRATRLGAISGFVVGTLIALFYTFAKVPTPFGMNLGILALIANVVVFVAISLLMKPQPKEHVEEFIGA